MGFMLKRGFGRFKSIYRKGCRNSKEDFIPNVLHAHETEGKLYGIPVSFSLHTVYGRTSDVGAETNMESG